MNGLALGTTSLVSISASSWKPQQRFSTMTCRASSSAIKSNFYSVLSISSPDNAGPEEIKRAYRAMALRYHPDMFLDPLMKEESTKMFVLIQEAYMTLSDPVLRCEHDFELGLCSLEQTSSSICGGRRHCELSGSLWRDQLSELIKMNDSATGREEGSWANRMRSRKE